MRFSSPVSTLDYLLLTFFVLLALCLTIVVCIVLRRFAAILMCRFRFNRMKELPDELRREIFYHAYENLDANFRKLYICMILGATAITAGALKYFNVI